MQISTICMRLSQKLFLRKSDKQLAWHLFLACWWRAAWKGKENNQVMLRNYIAKSRDFSLQVFDIGRVRALGLVEYKEGTCDEVFSLPGAKHPRAFCWVCWYADKFDGALEKRLTFPPKMTGSWARHSFILFWYDQSHWKSAKHLNAWQLQALMSYLSRRSFTRHVVQELITLLGRVVFDQLRVQFMGKAVFMNFDELLRVLLMSLFDGVLNSIRWTRALLPKGGLCF